MELKAPTVPPFRALDEAVLVVDDNLEVLRRVKTVLHSEGIMVDIAETAAEALAKMSTRRYKIVLLDAILPDLYGFDLLNRVTSIAPDSIVIMLVGRLDLDEVIDFIKEGADYVLRKPVESDRLLRVVKERLYRRESLLTHKVAVVVPALNEEELIGETLSSIPGFVEKIYAVDDGSEDRTFDIMLRFAKIDPRIVCIKRKKNGGVGAAIVSGYKRALEDGMDIAVVMAGDNQMDPSFMEDLIDPIIDGRADYVKANRLMSPEYRKGMGKWRFFGNAILTFLTKIASGYWNMMDPQNGYTAISRRALERLDLDSIYPWYGYCNDLLVKLNVYGFRVIDVMVPARYGREKSSIKYSKYIVKVSYMLLRNFFWRLKTKYILLSFHPLVLFYILGMIITPIGFFGGLYSLYYKFVMGRDLFIRGVLSLLLFIIGTQSLFFAMFFDMQNDSSYEKDEDKRR